MYEVYLWWTLCPSFHDCHLLNICDSNNPEFGLCFAAGSAVLRTSFTAWWKPWPRCQLQLCAQQLHQLSLLHRIKMGENGKLMKTSQNSFWSLDSNFQFITGFKDSLYGINPFSWKASLHMAGLDDLWKVPSNPTHPMILWFVSSRCCNEAPVSFYWHPTSSSATHRWPTAQHGCPRPLSCLG